MKNRILIGNPSLLSPLGGLFVELLTFNEWLPTFEQSLMTVALQTTSRSEGFPERDIWFLGTLDQGSARCPELLGNRRRHLEIKVEIQARKLLLEVLLRFWGRGERSRRMETGVLLRISIRIQ